ncbi:MAG: DUF3800 domain-containing protein [Mycoplasma sp.]|nr:DUF3800 domain-containing protein [Mycoplasma sp.]
MKFYIIKIIKLILIILKKEDGMIYIFIDESGSLNNKNVGLFSVSLVFVKKNDSSWLKNHFKRNIKKLKNKLGIPLKNELKAHDFVKNKKLYDLFNFIKEIKSVKSYSSYILNKGIDNRYLKNKNVTFNFLVKSALERAVENIDYFKVKQDIKIIVDNREIATGSLKSLKDYLDAEFIVKKDIFKNIELEYMDSRRHWGVQLADFFSYLNYWNVKNSNSKPNNRKIY